MLQHLHQVSNKICILYHMKVYNTHLLHYDYKALKIMSTEGVRYEL